MPDNKPHINTLRGGVAGGVALEARVEDAALEALDVALEAHHLELQLEGAQIHKVVIHANDGPTLRR